METNTVDSPAKFTDSINQMLKDKATAAIGSKREDMIAASKEKSDNES